MVCGLSLSTSFELSAQKTVEKYENGNKKYQGKKSDGVNVGKHIYWFENGKKQKEETYDNRGVMIRLREWNTEGELLKDENPEEGIERLRNKQFKGFKWIPVQQGIAYFKLKGNEEIFEPLRNRDGLTVQYATYLENGKELDSTFRKNEAITVDFLNNRLIQGFVEGLKYFEPGDNGYIRVPSYLAYGSEGSNGVPPDATLIFQVIVLQ